MSKRRVLFVDDEPFIISGLQRMLRKQRSEWDMDFALSGPEALAKMAELPFDVIVTDVQMPGMTGVELLERMVEAYPNTARIVLSGHADDATTTRAIDVAHQYVSKPATPEALTAAVSQACNAQQVVCNEEIRALVATCGTLPSLPTLFVEITQAASSDTADAKSIARIIARDMAMSAKILKLVNSSFFGIGRRVSSIEESVALMGTLRIKALVLTEHVFKEFRPKNNLAASVIRDLWRHSWAVAEVASAISKTQKQAGDRTDQAFTAGLLHDIGLLILASQAEDRFERVLEASEANPRPIDQIEKELLGVSHGEVGGYLLGLWGLPPRIVEAVVLHHNPGETLYNGLCALTCVHVADSLVPEICWSQRDRSSNPFAQKTDLAYLERIGLAGRLEAWTQLAHKTCRNLRDNLIE